MLQSLNNVLSYEHDWPGFLPVSAECTGVNEWQQTELPAKKMAHISQEYAHMQYQLHKEVP